MDLDKEIAKCTAKLTIANANADKLRKAQAQENYETAVPEPVRISNAEKVRTVFTPVSA